MAAPWGEWEKGVGVFSPQNMMLNSRAGWMEKGRGRALRDLSISLDEPSKRSFYVAYEVDISFVISCLFLWACPEK